jgi:hypothetical protein
MVTYEADYLITLADGTNVEVMLCPCDVGPCGPAYTKEEWDAGIAADYERTPAGWMFQGQPFAGEVRKLY